MLVSCTGCTRRLQWSAKQDKRLSELKCPHCGSSYTRGPTYIDWGDPSELQRRADEATVRLELAAHRLEQALAEAPKLAQLLIAAHETVKLLEKPRLKLLARTEGGVV